MKPIKSTRALCIYAGRKARGIIRDEGLRPERVKVMVGAAGGPKWLVLHGLDSRLPAFFAGRKHPLFLIGASIGAWRFLCTVLGNGAFERFREAYIEQRYLRKPTPREVSDETRRILERLMDGCTADRAMAHPFYRLNILAVRSRRLFRSGYNTIQGIGLAGAALANLAGRRLLNLFFERTLFYDNRDIPPFLGMRDFPTQPVALSAGNLRQAIVASGSIPLVMEGVPDIPGASTGVYFDGGVTDYHIDIDYLEGDGDSLVLYPHYTDRIIPGWLDKRLTWRIPLPGRADNLVLLCPSREFVQALPYEKIPDRKDFTQFFQRDDERIAYWRTTVERSERLGEEFEEALSSGCIRDKVRPLPWEK